MPFRDAKTLKIELNDYGDSLHRAEGCFEVKHKDGKTEKYPIFQKEVGECVLKTGSYVSVDALADLMLWNIDTYIETRRNRVVGMLRSIEDDNHVATRVAQYQAFSNGKADEIAKEIIKAKINGQNAVLRKYELRPVFYDVSSVSGDKKKLLGIESKAAMQYFQQIFKLFPENIRPKKRTGYKSYEGIDNVFNFGYYILRCRVHKALLKAKLEPYLGFVHSIQAGKPSLVCDMMELWRFVVDDFLIQRCRKYHKKDFVLVTDFMMKLKMGKRIHLVEYEADELAAGLNELFERVVNLPRMRNGNRQTLDTLISEECYLLAQYLRSEKQSWIPRLVRC